MTDSAPNWLRDFSCDIREEVVHEIARGIVITFAESERIRETAKETFDVVKTLSVAILRTTRNVYEYLFYRISWDELILRTRQIVDEILWRPVVGAVVGVTSGAVAGAVIGSFVPGLGTVAGGVLGGLGGTLLGVYVARST